MAKKQKVEINSDMSLEEAKAYRASLAVKKEKVFTEAEKREAFRIFWAQEKAKYNKDRNIESILWLHLKAIKMDTPDQFESGIQNFGLKKVR
jgi:hypothetical protein